MTVDDVLALLGETLQVDQACITLTTKATDLESWDSMGTMNLLLALDQAYGLKLAPGETAKLQSVEGVLELLRKAGKLP